MTPIKTVRVNVVYTTVSYVLAVSTRTVNNRLRLDAPGVDSLSNHSCWLVRQVWGTGDLLCPRVKIRRQAWGTYSALESHWVRGPRDGAAPTASSMFEPTFIYIISVYLEEIP